MFSIKILKYHYNLIKLHCKDIQNYHFVVASIIRLFRTENFTPEKILKCFINLYNYQLLFKRQTLRSLACIFRISLLETIDELSLIWFNVTIKHPVLFFYLLNCDIFSWII